MAAAPTEWEPLPLPTVSQRYDALGPQLRPRIDSQEDVEVSA